jgi:hypothetical protein
MAQKQRRSNGGAKTSRPKKAKTVAAPPAAAHSNPARSFIARRK